MLKPKTPVKKDLPALTGRDGMRLPYLLVQVQSQAVNVRIKTKTERWNT